LRYGHLCSPLEDFLGSMGSATTLPEGRSRTASVNAPTDLPVGAPYAVCRAHPVARLAYPSSSPLSVTQPEAAGTRGGAGICTSCPSPTPFGLGLGPPDPGTINVAQETLDFRRTGFSPVFTLLMPAFALVRAPRGLTLTLQSHARRSPTNVTRGDAPWLRYDA
jgi:hypothetical protein